MFNKHKRVLSALTLMLAVALIFWVVNTPVLVDVSAETAQV